MAVSLNRNKKAHKTEKCPLCQGTDISRNSFGAHGSNDLVQITFACENCGGFFYVFCEPVYWKSIPEAQVVRPLSDLVLEEEET
jgi:hypothetical protein